MKLYFVLNINFIFATYFSRVALLLLKISKSSQTSRIFFKLRDQTQDVALELAILLFGIVRTMLRYPCPKHRVSCSRR